MIKYRVLVMYLKKWRSRHWWSMTVRLEGKWKATEWRERKNMFFCIRMKFKGIVLLWIHTHTPIQWHKRPTNYTTWNKYSSIHRIIEFASIGIIWSTKRYSFCIFNPFFLRCSSLLSLFSSRPTTEKATAKIKKNKKPVISLVISFGAAVIFPLCICYTMWFW